MILIRDYFGQHINPTPVSLPASLPSLQKIFMLLIMQLRTQLDDLWYKLRVLYISKEQKLRIGSWKWLSNFYQSFWEQYIPATYRDLKPRRFYYWVGGIWQRIQMKKDELKSFFKNKSPCSLHLKTLFLLSKHFWYHLVVLHTGLKKAERWTLTGYSNTVAKGELRREEWWTGYALQRVVTDQRKILNDSDLLWLGEM